MRIRCQRKLTFIGILVLLSLFLCCTASAASVFAGGDGTAENPYQITTVEQLIAVNDDLDACYILMNDLDLSGIAKWEPIGGQTGSFEGSFDGNGHIISNIHLEVTIPPHDSNDVADLRYGLFSSLHNATITRLGIEDANYTISATSSDRSSGPHGIFIGGFAGTAGYSLIDQCYFSGSLAISAHTPAEYYIGYNIWGGGITGEHENSTISNCYTTGNITGSLTSVFEKDDSTINLGGITGSLYNMYNTVSTCYTTAEISLVRTKGLSGRNGSECYIGGICARSISDMRNCVAMPIKLSATGNNTYAHSLGMYATVENCYFLSPDSESAKSQSYFESVGFDFLNIWTINQSHPKLKAFVYTKPTYAEQHGWCFPNWYDSFGYLKGSKLDTSKFLDMYGYSISNIFHHLKNNTTMSTFNGFCHGMTLLSLAQYYGKIDMHPFFTSNQPCLYDFGRDSEPYTTAEGKQTYTIRNNALAIELVHEASLSQLSYDFSESRIFENDDHYEQLLAFFNSEQATPLMVSTHGTSPDNPKFRDHTMIVTTDTKPQKSKIFDGFYELPLYDPNVPAQSSELTSPIENYTKKPRRLLVNPSTSEWKVVAGNDVIYSHTYRNGLSGGGFWFVNNQAIQFFDIRKLDESFFTFRGLKVWPFQIVIQINDPDIEIKNSDTKETVLQIVDNEIVKLSEDSACHKWIGTDELGGGTNYTFCTNQDMHLQVTSSNGSFVASSDQHIMSASANASHEIILDFENGTIIANGKDSSGEISMFIQEIDSGKAMAVTAPSKADASIALSINNGEAMTSNYSILDPEFLFDQVAPSAIPQHILTEVPAKPSTCTEHGNIAYLYCEHCDHLFTDVITQTETTIGEVTLPLLPHSGGQANCISPAVCSMCGTPYGETDPNLHTGETELRNQKEPTESESGYSGDIHCSGCQVMLEAGAEIPSLSIESTPTPTPTSTPTPTPTPTPTLTPTPTPSIEETVSPAPFSNEIPPKAGDHTPLRFIMLVTACAALSLTIIGTSHYYKRKT